MFKNYNTDGIHIKNVFTAKVNETDVGKRIRSFGETKFCQLGIKFKGATSITYNNRKYVYDDNSVLFLPCENRSDIPYNKVFQRPGVGICIFFKSEYPLGGEAKIYNLQNCAVQNAFKRILHEYRSGEFLRVKSTFYEILSLLDESEKPQGKDEFSDVLDYINENVDAPYIDLRQTAEQFGCSPDYFRHKFRKKAGVSPKQYISAMKIRTAKELLLGSDLNISQVAQKAGFENPNYFSRFFKKETGCTPMQFREKFKGYFF